MEWAIGILLAAMVASIAAGAYFHDKALNVRKLETKKSKVTENISKFERLDSYQAGTLCVDVGQWLIQNEEKEELVIESENGLKLYAYLIKARFFTHHYVIFLHGYTSSAQCGGSFIHQLFLMEYNVLAPDARAHGRSDGTHTSMGYFERWDVIKWIDEILAIDPDAKIVLYGISMGAATVMFTIGNSLPQNVVCAIEDCGYSGVWDIFKNHLKCSYHLPAFPVLYAAEAVTRIKMGFSYHGASAKEALKCAALPTLFIHGEKDEFVPFWMLQTVYDAHPGPKEILAVANAGHAQSSTVAYDLYWNTFKDFVCRYLT